MTTEALSALLQPSVDSWSYLIPRNARISTQEFAALIRANSEAPSAAEAALALEKVSGSLERKWNGTKLSISEPRQEQRADSVAQDVAVPVVLQEKFEGCPYAEMVSPVRLYRSVSPAELIHIVATGSVAGGMNRFNTWDKRREVFFADQLNAQTIGQGEDVSRRVDNAILDHPLHKEYVAAVELLDEKRAAASHYGALLPDDVRRDLRSTSDAITGLQKRARAVLNDLLSAEQSANGRRLYTSAVIETKPMVGGRHYSKRWGHAGMGDDDEYGFDPGAVTRSDIVTVHLVKNGEVVKTLSFDEVVAAGPTLFGDVPAVEVPHEPLVAASPERLPAGAYLTLEEFEKDYEAIGNLARAAMVFAGMGRTIETQRMSLPIILRAINDDRMAELRIDPASTKYANLYNDLKLAAYHMQRDSEKHKIVLPEIRGPWAAKLFDFYAADGEISKHPHLAPGIFKNFKEYSVGYRAQPSKKAAQSRQVVLRNPAALLVAPTQGRERDIAAKSAVELSASFYFGSIIGNERDRSVIQGMGFVISAAEGRAEQTVFVVKGDHAAVRELSQFGGAFKSELLEWQEQMQGKPIGEMTDGQLHAKSAYLRFAIGDRGIAQPSLPGELEDLKIELARRQRPSLDASPSAETELEI